MTAASKDPQADLRKVQERIQALQRATREDTTRRDALATQLRDAEDKVRAARARLTETRKRLAESDQKLKALAGEREKQEAVLEDQRGVLAAQLRAAYMSGREEQVKLLLSQKDPAAFGRMLVYYSYLGKARASQIDEISAAVARLEEATAGEAAERERLAALEAERVQELAAVDNARAERGRAVMAMNSQIRSNTDTISRLKREAAALEKLIAELRRALRDAPPPGGQAFERVKGKLSWPVAGKVVARFGQSRGGGLRWNGLLIQTERGSNVHALYDGRVVYADWLTGLGLLMILDHGGYLSLYAHTEELYKEVGERVSAGDVIGSAGDSGGRARPELYLELRRGSQPVDPQPWFRRPNP